MLVLFENSFDYLILYVWKRYPFRHFNLLGYASFDVLSIVPCAFNYKGVIVLDFDRPSIAIHFLHALHTINPDKISVLKSMLELLINCDLSLVLVRYVVDQEDWQVLSRVHHFKSIAKVSEHVAVEAHLTRKDHTAVIDIVLSEHRVDPNNSIDVINVAKYEQVKFLCIFRL